MNILNCMAWRGKAGTERAFIAFAKALTESGFVVTNLVDEGFPFISELTAYSEKIVTGSIDQSRQDWSADTFCSLVSEIINKNRIEIVLSHQQPHAQLISAICFEFLPHVSVVHNEVAMDYYLGCDRIIVLSDQMRKNFVNAGFESKRIYKLFLPMAPKAPFQLKVPHKPISIGFMGRLEKQKAPDLLLLLLVELQKREISFKCQIGGEGSMLGELEAFAQNHSIKNLSFLGYVDDHSAFYEKVDILFLMSRFEPFGLVVLEAFAHSTPVLATRVAGPMEIINHMQNGILVNNWEEAVNEVRMLVDNPSVLGKLAKEGYRTLGQFSELNFAQQLELLLRVTRAKWGGNVV